MNKQLRVLSDDILSKHFLGYDRIWNQFSNLQGNAYPPHNVIDAGDGVQLIELAIAGFDPADISITVERGILSITGILHADDDIRVFLHQGIATRKFVKQFSLNEYVEVTKAEFDNGILTISIKEEIPEVQKPKVIKIEHKS